MIHPEEPTAGQVILGTIISLLICGYVGDVEIRDLSAFAVTWFVAVVAAWKIDQMRRK